MLQEEKRKKREREQNESEAAAAAAAAPSACGPVEPFTITKTITIGLEVRDITSLRKGFSISVLMGQCQMSLHADSRKRRKRRKTETETLK